MIKDIKKIMIKDIKKIMIKDKCDLTNARLQTDLQLTEVVLAVI